MTRSLCEVFSAHNLPHNVISGCQAWVYFLTQERIVNKLLQTNDFIVSQLTRVHPVRFVVHLFYYYGNEMTDVVKKQSDFEAADQAGMALARILDCLIQVLNSRTGCYECYYE